MFFFLESELCVLNIAADSETAQSCVVLTVHRCVFSRHIRDYLHSVMLKRLKAYVNFTLHDRPHLTERLYKSVDRNITHVYYTSWIAKK